MHKVSIKMCEDELWQNGKKNNNECKVLSQFFIHKNTQKKYDYVFNIIIAYK